MNDIAWITPFFQGVALGLGVSCLAHLALSILPNVSKIVRDEMSKRGLK